jgi:hypothetical protein
LLRRGDQFIPEIKDWVIWEPACRDTGTKESLFTTGRGIRILDKDPSNVVPDR